MSWSDNLLDASFRGVAFDCVSTSDDLERAVAVYEYPYQDGADTEDMGEKPWHISMQAIFYGDDYDQRLKDFLDVLRVPGPGELIHPIYGSMTVQLLSVNIDHDAESPDSARVSLSFMESTVGQQLFSRELASQQAEAASMAADSVSDIGAGVFSDAIDQLKKLEQPFTKLNQLRDRVIGTLQQLASRVNGVIYTGLDVLNFPQSFIADLKSVFNSIATPRLDSGEVSLDEFTRAVSIITTPLSSMTAPSNIHTDAAFSLTQATSVATVAATLFAAEIESPSLTPSQLESVLITARESIQSAIAVYRTTYDVVAARPVIEGLRDTAAKLQQTAKSIIISKPPLVIKQVESDGNLHQIAYRWYGDYTRAEELIRLNPSLRNPNFIQQGDLLNAYAQ
ncbi:DNA circularization N-terminal domain-containing protein [Leeia sp. TBRC 13508]|uniref:DNA circularization N-terminal domain-containing protein n=1 Tax=Leeia speluncae TaxID=2884804 RepID=A0ABS8D289_9NEIS|nr:DNA circularization N-terminal domain-containing protein [Leeia speluncae]MCB6182309.1 DNA circularization N-terminal domain-containing protein [Leeia speluncae]